MSQRGRRVLVFVAMVAAGLVLVLLLSDPLQKRRSAVIGELPAGDAGDGQLRVVDGQRNQATSFSFPGELQFDVLETTEVAPGRFEERPAYRVHIMSGQSDPASGAFLASRPTVSLLDDDGRTQTGTLRADQARFELGSTVGGTLAIDFSHMDAESFALIGNVEGDFPVADGEPAHLTAERLEMDNGIVTGPGIVTWKRTDMTIEGRDMTWDGDLGRIEFARDVRLDMAATDQRKGLQLVASGGMSWTVPPGAADSRHAASGELRGHVTGTTTDGSTLETERLVIDGPARTLTLLGPSKVEVSDEQAPLSLASEHLVVQSDDIATRVSSEQAVHWSRRGMSGHGTGLRWDDQSGHLHFDRDVQLEFETAPGGAAGAAGAAGGAGEPASRWQLSSDGSFDWTLPPGAADPLAEGHGEVRGNVRGGNADGSFQTELLRVDGRSGTVTLDGPSTFERRKGRDEISVRAGSSIAVKRAADGTPSRVSAQGKAEVLLKQAGSTAGPTRIAGESLLVDRLTRELSVHGNAVVERPGSDPPLRVRAANHIRVRTDELDEVISVDADGGVACTSGEYEVRGDRLRWDMEFDRAVLYGDCRILASGAWMSASQIELSPRAETFRILRATLHVQP